VIDLDRLIGLALGDLDASDATVGDEHVLACGPCASVLERLLAIGGAVRTLVRAGQIAFPASAAMVERLAAAGLISRRYQLAPDQALPCSVGPADIYTATTLEGPAELRGVQQIDIVRTTPAGSTRMRDVPFERRSGLVTFLSRSDVLRMLPSVRIQLDLVAVDPSGERKLAAYFLDHTALASPL
jgi:hypothetical protein